MISEELLEGTVVEEIGKIQLQYVAGIAIPVKVVKNEVPMSGCEAFVPRK